MVHIDWKKMMAITPEGLTEEEKDDLYESVAWYIPDLNLDRKYLVQFIRVVQEVLKFKAEQVESLMNELDDIASKQGEEEARKRQDLLDEIEDLKEQLEYHKRLDQDGSRPLPTTHEELKSEVVKLEMQNEELLFELQEREKELMNEKTEIENYASQVATLEREKLELLRELTALQEETTEKLNAKSMRDSPEFGPEKQEELTEVIRQKNKHITQLLDDIDVVEKENLSLRTKLNNVRDELAETTTHITAMTGEMSRLRHVIEDYEKKFESLEEQKKGLLSQIEELVEEKARHDKQLDEFAVTLNSKVQEWKDVLDSKDKEIGKCKDEIKRLMASSSMLISSDFGDVEANQKVTQQEEEIKLLKKELLKATEELNKCSELIEQLKEKKDIKLPDGGGQVSGLEDRIQYLEEKLKYAEEDAHAKAEEMSELVIQLREYEAGEFGLSDAVARIKKLDKVIQRKDAQIEKLIESCNNLEIEFENLEEQNMTLRERLGLSATDEIDTSYVKLKFKKDVEMIENLKLQLEKKEEDLIKVKLKNRKLIKYLKLKPPVSLDSVSSDDSRSDGKKVEKYKRDISDLEKKLLSIIKENDALRKGMHEILESIHNQDGSGTVEVQSTCLERLLEALDSRHVSGWYHPAMRLQAQLKSVEGKNEELRNQIRNLRIEDNKIIEELNIKIQTLESDVGEVKSRSKSSETGDDEEEEAEEDGEIAVRTVTNIEQEQKITELEMELQQLKFLYDKKNSEADSMEYLLKTEKEELNIKIAGMESQIKELESKSQPDEVKSAEMASNLVILERKVNFLGNLENMLRLTTEKLREEMIETEERILQDVIRIQSDKLTILLKVENLEKKLLKSVPKERFDAVNRELIETAAKYQEAVNLSITKYDDGIVEKLQKEIELLENEKQEILDELRIHKEKLIAAESVANGDMVTQDAFSNEISVLSGKLAASEVRELNEKQKSTHLENVNLMIRSELQELEAHNKDLTEYIGKLTEANNKLRETERELRGKMTREESEDINELSEKLEVLKNKYKELSIEKDNIQELFEISQGQCRALQNWRDMDKLQMASQNEEILNLQSGNDDKMIIARLSHELLTSQLTTAQLTKKNSDLQDRVSKLLTRNICLEAKIDEDKREAFELKWKHFMEVEYLYEVINDVRKLYGNVIMFPDVESVYNAKMHLQNERNDLRSQLDELKIRLHEYSIKREECEVQLEALNDLKSALQGDNKNLITWHNRSTEFRLKEARYRRQNEFLIGEMSQLEKCVKKLNEEITNLEEKSIERERAWEQKQIIWEETQFELCQLLQEKGIKRTPTPIVTYCDQGTDADNKTVSTNNVEHFVRIIDDQTEAIKKYETQIQDLESEVLRLKKELDEKETIIMLKEKLMNNSKPKTLELEETVSRDKSDKSDEAEKAALKVTVQSLQNIIKQKEETIFRYQDLLKEGRDEYSKASGKLQEELRNLHETLTNQNKAYNRLKNSIQASQQSKDNIPVALEKYITKIHELEDELIEARSNLTNMNSQLYAVQQEAERWRSVAEDRLLLMEDMRQRLEVEYRNEMENFKEEIQAYQGEIDHLKQLLDAGHGEVNHGHNHKLVETIQQHQMKLLHYEETSGKKASDWMLDKSIKNKTVQAQREIESLKRQLKFSKDESARLREQIRLLQLSKPTKRPRTGSSTTRSGSDSKNSIKEESLLSKIKTLEELLQISKERERELLESSQQRLKSAEEVARWDEKKRCQQTIDHLNSKLKEKDVEIEVLKNKNDSFRNMIHRCERERNILETQLKAAKGGPGGPSAKIEKLKCDKLALEAEVSALRKRLEDQERHESGYGAALLHEKLECQERKLAVLELASHGRDQIVIELERLKTINTSLEKVNLKLESDNLSLSLNLEKAKAELKHLTERNKQLEKLSTLQQATEDASELHQLESDRTISSLHQTIEKLTADNKRLRNMQNKEPRSYGTVEKVRKDLLKLKEEHKNLRTKYLQVVDRNSALEDELKKCRYQICLLEEKDLADSISKTNNLQLASDLSQELLQVKSQLAHKTHLLERVKVLLTKAAAKEKALNEQVSVLQSMVPASAIRESC